MLADEGRTVADHSLSSVGANARAGAGAGAGADASGGVGMADVPMSTGMGDGGSGGGPNGNAQHQPTRRLSEKSLAAPHDRQYVEVTTLLTTSKPQPAIRATTL